MLQRSTRLHQFFTHHDVAFADKEKSIGAKCFRLKTLKRRIMIAYFVEEFAGQPTTLTTYFIKV